MPPPPPPLPPARTGFCGPLLFRREGVETPQATRAVDVPLWAFIVMTVFTLVLLIFVGFLLWRPRWAFGQDLPSCCCSHGQHDDQELDKHNDHQKKPQKKEGQQQHQCQRAGSNSRPPWLRGGSFRRDIERWRRGVTNRDSLPQRGEAAGGYSDGEDPVVRAYSYAPAVAARPVSRLSEIPEYYVDATAAARVLSSEQNQ